MGSALSIFKHTEVLEKTVPFRRVQSQGHRLEGKTPGLCGEREAEQKRPEGSGLGSEAQLAQGQGTWLLREDKEAPAGGGVQGPPHPRAEAGKPHRLLRDAA